MHSSKHVMGLLMHIPTVFEFEAVWDLSVFAQTIFEFRECLGLFSSCTIYELVGLVSSCTIYELVGLVSSCTYLN